MFYKRLNITFVSVSYRSYCLIRELGEDQIYDGRVFLKYCGGWGGVAITYYILWFTNKLTKAVTMYKIVD